MISGKLKNQISQRIGQHCWNMMARSLEDPANGHERTELVDWIISALLTPENAREVLCNLPPDHDMFERGKGMAKEIMGKKEKEKKS